MRNQYIGIAILGIFVLIVCIAGFSIVGTPISQKAIKFDEARFSDFSVIKSAVEDYYTKSKTLPNSLSSLTFTYSPEPKDPESKQSYEYQKVTDTEYKPSATFSTDSEEVYKNNATNNHYNYSYDPTDMNKHKKGYDCIKYSLPTYLIPPTPTPQQALFQFIKTTRDQTLCLGQSYEIEWVADVSLDGVSPYLISSAVPAEVYLIYPDSRTFARNSPITNSTWKHSQNWVVGDAIDYLSKKQQTLKPGKYTFAASVSKYPNYTANSVQDYISNYQITISDCSGTPGAPQP
ncbi:MAG TPA: hypothetical protein VLG67_00585 [Candidatus Saccharimonadales bacterium]|nr:hypothetical protein [Candidatus Saccharimonadales bacterium]